MKPERPERDAKIQEMTVNALWHLDMAGLEGKLDEYLSKSSGIQQEMLESDDFMKTLARSTPEEVEEAQQGPTCRSAVVHAVARPCAQRS